MIVELEWSTRRATIGRVSRGRKLLLLTLILAMVPVASVPTTTLPFLDPYQRRVPNELSWQVSTDPEIWETTCDAQDRVEQAGVVTFRTMTLATFGGGVGNIWACTRFEHEEGRAWDWMNDAGNPADVVRVEAMLRWLLAPDEFGRKHEMARRLGLAYIIWNQRIITFWGSNRTWRPYNCANNPTPGNCHTNHVHFAFSWAGARAQTSWFATSPTPLAWVPTPLSTEDGTGLEAVPAPERP
jgi:hypothetical protein